MRTKVDDLSKTPLDELILIEAAVANERAILADKQRELRHEIDRRAAVTELVEGYKNLDAAGREALISSIQAEGIASGEKFGKLGG